VLAVGSGADPESRDSLGDGRNRGGQSAGPRQA
jgi:hypothetical protein